MGHRPAVSGRTLVIGPVEFAVGSDPDGGGIHVLHFSSLKLLARSRSDDTGDSTNSGWHGCNQCVVVTRLDDREELQLDQTCHLFTNNTNALPWTQETEKPPFNDRMRSSRPKLLAETSLGWRNEHEILRVAPPVYAFFFSRVTMRAQTRSSSNGLALTYHHQAIKEALCDKTVGATHTDHRSSLHHAKCNEQLGRQIALSLGRGPRSG